MTVADIAYDNLTPATRTRVDALLQRHRHCGLWMSQMPVGYTDKARFAFMKATTWPDDIRKTPDDRPTWHHSDILARSSPTKPSMIGCWKATPSPSPPSTRTPLYP